MELGRQREQQIGMAQTHSFCHRRPMTEAAPRHSTTTTSHGLVPGDSGKIGAIPRKIVSFLTQAPVVDKWEEGETSFRVRSNINPQHSGVQVVVFDPRKRSRDNETGTGSAGERNHETEEEDHTRGKLASPSSSSFASSSFSSVSHNAVPVVNAMCNGKYFETEECEDCNRRDHVGPFRQNDLVSGCVIIAVKDGWTHNGIYLTVLGQVTFPQIATNPFLDRLLEPEKAHQRETQQLYQQQKHLQSILPPRIRMIELCVPLLPKGKLAYGVHQIPFSFPLEPCDNMFQDRSSSRRESDLDLYETLHGERVRVDYNLHVCIDRGVFLRPIDSQAEIKVETPVIVARRNDCAGTPMKFTVSSTDIDRSRNVTVSVGGSGMAILPPIQCDHSKGQQGLSFSLECTLQSKVLDLSDPVIRGNLVLKRCECTTVKSASIVMKRFESFFFGIDPSNILHENQCTVAWSKIGTIANCQSAGEDQSTPFEMEVPDLQVVPSFCFVPSAQEAYRGTTTSARPLIGFEIKYSIELVVKLGCGRRATSALPLHVVRSSKIMSIKA